METETEGGVETKSGVDRDRRVGSEEKERWRQRQKGGWRGGGSEKERCRQRQKGGWRRGGGSEKQRWKQTEGG